MSRRIHDAAADREAAVALASKALRDGKLVVLPTDTVYGVAADAFNSTGTRRVFGAKRRSRRFPLPVLVRTPKQLLGLCTSVPESADRLMAAYWPGPLTLILPCDPGLEWDLGDNRGTVAVRMPLDDLTLEVIRAVGPIAVTSANLSGQPAATTAQDAHLQLGELVEAYIDDGVRGDTAPSTIVDLTRDEPHILREGPIDPDDIIAVVNGTLEPVDASARFLASTAQTDWPDDEAEDAGEAPVQAAERPSDDGDAGDDAGDDDAAR